MKLKKADYAVIGAIAVVLSLLIYYGAYVPIRMLPTNTCAGNLRHLVTAMQMYAANHVGQLPPADNWRDALINGYADDLDRFVCPEAHLTLEQQRLYVERQAQDVPFSVQRAPDGYAMYRPLSAINPQRLADPAATPVLYDSDIFLPSAADELQSLAFRHPGRTAIVVYMDGHGGPTSVRPELPARVLLEPGERPIRPSGPAAQPGHEGHGH